MKIIGKYLKHLFNSQHQAEVTLLVENFRHCAYLNELVIDTEYSVEIKKVKSKRSLQQNKYFWKLLYELEKESKQDVMIWYTHLLEETNCKFEYLWAMEETEDTLKKTFRAIKRVKPHKIKDSEGWLYKCFMGSSKYSVQEMTELIETLLRYCAEYNIDTEVLRYE